VLDDTPTALAAFGAGALSIVSPAFVALVPGVCAFLWNRGTAQVVAFFLGFSLVFVALGAGATSVGQALLENLPLAERAAGVTLLAIGGRELRAVKRGDEASAPLEPATAASVVIAFTAGAALMFGWTPIGGTVLNRIIAIATSADAIDRGLWLLAANAAGRALPFSALAVANGMVIRWAIAAGVPRRHPRLIAGVFVTLSGVLLVSGLFPRVAAALVPLLPLA
jgi:cytochrome c-type biogenesis protein